ERRTSFELPVELVGDVTQLDHLRHRMTVATRPSHVNVWQRWRVNIGALAVPGIPRVLTPPGLQDRDGGLAAQQLLLGRSPAVHGAAPSVRPTAMGTTASSTTAAETAILTLCAYACARCTMCHAISSATGPTTDLLCRKKLALRSMASACTAGTSTSLKIASTG